MKKILLAIAVLLLTVSAGYCQDQALQPINKNSPLTLTIKSDKQVYKAGEDIWIQLTIKNLSEKKYILSSPMFIISSNYIRNPIYSPVKFSDNTFHVNPNEEVNAILESKKIFDFKYNLYNLKWGNLVNSIGWANEPLYRYTKPGKYSISFGVVKEPKDYQSNINYFTSNTITIEVVEKKDKVAQCWEKAKSIQVGMSKAEVEKICERDGGLQSQYGSQRYYIRNCYCEDRKLIKVDVEFSKKDNLVIKVSEPYCEYAIGD